MIKPKIIRRNEQFECHRALIVGIGETRQEAWDNMWELHYHNVTRRPTPREQREKQLREHRMPKLTQSAGA